MAERKYLKNNPILLEEFDFEKNTNVDISSITMGMNSRFWWKCKQGHRWQASPNNRQRTGCPVCAGKQVLRGFNDLESQNPDIAAEWDVEKNDKLPSDVTAKSSQLAWWKCEKGHSWQARISNRVSLGRGCPYCSNQKILPGYNDLVTIHPELSEEWDYKKNDIAPNTVGAGSTYKAWWKCNRFGHSWQAEIKDRVHGNGCPFCSGRKTLKGFNDLATVRPELLLEWDYEKNDVDPTSLSPSNEKKVWWKCFRGHSYLSAVYNRAAGKGCPFCISELKTSFPEQTILFYLKQVTKAESRHIEFGKEIDVFLPELNAGIEYNGEFYHKDKHSKDIQKKVFFAEHGIRIISVNESDKYDVTDSTIEYNYSDSIKGLEWVINKLSVLLNLPLIHVDIKNDRQKIYSQFIDTQKENSLLAKYPDIAQSWNYDKNGSIRPDMVSFASKKVFWWRCDKGHEWQAAVGSRTTLSHGCPFCSSQRVLAGFNDLETKYPRIAKEWHPTRNEGVNPNEVLPSSNKKFWWLGSCGHEWETSPLNRINGTGCPVCANKVIISGQNDLATLFPKIASEWLYEKNNESPNNVGAGSGKKYWWKCSKCGCEWQSIVVNRTRGHGCPKCWRKNNSSID